MRLIDADALYDVFEEKYKGANGAYRTAFREALNDICDAPTIDPAKRGRWTFDHMTGEQAHYAYCSNCAAMRFWGSDKEYFDYCPHCGAKMDLEA